MNDINLLDCTLRDGGYVNNWKFGAHNIDKIINKVSESGIEIIEVGYLVNQSQDDIDVAKFTSLDSIYERLHLGQLCSQTFAAMINFGDYPIENIGECKHDIILRVAFHKKDMIAALDYISTLVKRGYRVFVQPMGVLAYSDSEFIDLINRVNKIVPSAFYIVDSFGVVELYDFNRLIYLADNNLEPTIRLGYHSHNNLQQAYSNSKYLVEQHLKRDLIVDASIFGMGRGAGNLNEELFERFLNKYYLKQYRIEPLLEAFDECLRPIFLINFWGYSFPFYLSSIHNCHPNYASFFVEKNTLSVKSLNEVLSSISDSDKLSFSKEKANVYYETYMKNLVNDKNAIIDLTNLIKDKNILIIAPGSSLNSFAGEINAFIEKNNPVTFGVNSKSNMFKYDFLFVSNEKRAVGLTLSEQTRVIRTSNLTKSFKADDIVVNYSSYLCDDKTILDNSGLMLIKLLIKCGCNRLFLCGFDGYSFDSNSIYYDSSLILGTHNSSKMEKNESIKNQFKLLKKSIDIHFLTNSIYDN